MKFVAAALLLTSLAPSSAAVTKNVCMKPNFSALHSNYHDDSQCNRQLFHEYKSALPRHAKYNELKATGNSQVPNEKTVFCPKTVHDIKKQHGVNGFDTVWLVENTSSSPVVLAFVDDKGVERAAMNPKVAPNEDPHSLLIPGAYKAVNTFEGHVFHARELLPDGGMGMVVLQHRVGLIPIGKSGQPENANCDISDPEPIVEETAEREPAFQRAPPVAMRECNQLDVGFRNNVGCPLHGYWVKPNDETCQEKFKLHLGVNAMSHDFMNAWDSPTKFETSFIGHTFVFRRADTGVEVDRITLAPTQVSDCPNLKQANAIAVDAEGIMVPVLRGDLVQRNATHSVNTTETPSTISSQAHIEATSF